MSVPIGQQPIGPGAPLSEPSSVQGSIAPKASVIGGHSYKKYTGFTGKILSLFGKVVKIEGDKGGSFYVRKSDIARTITKLAESYQKEFPELKRTSEVLIKTLFRTKITKQDLDEGFVGTVANLKNDAVMKMKQQFLSFNVEKWKELTSLTPKELLESPKHMQVIEQARNILQDLASHPEVLASLDFSQLEQLNTIADYAPSDFNPSVIQQLPGEIADVYNSTGMQELMAKGSKVLTEATGKIGKEQRDELFSQLQKEHFVIIMGNKLLSQSSMLDDPKEAQERILDFLHSSEERIKVLCSKIEDAGLIEGLIQRREVQVDKDGVPSQPDMTPDQTKYGDFSSTAGGLNTIEPFLKARLKELQGK